MTPEPSPIPGDRRPADDGPGLTTAFTLVVWVACVAIGLTGLWSAPPPPPRPPPASRPVTQVVSVTLESEPTPPEPAAAPSAAAAVAEAAGLPSVPTAALPSAAIAFAVPVAGPARPGPAAAAAVPVGGMPAPSHHLTAGSTGGDRLPQPTYPPDADRAGQTGTVQVGFTVDPDGRVTRAWLIHPSRWPLLNEEAIRAALATPQPPGGAVRNDDYTPTFR